MHREFNCTGCHYMSQASKKKQQVQAGTLAAAWYMMIENFLYISYH